MIDSCVRQVKSQQGKLCLEFGKSQIIKCGEYLFFALQKQNMTFGLASLFNGISTFVSSLMPKPSL